ncbi:unnamed protein product [Cladocopium goreaui]|uniref:DnaJ-like subfamily B member 14 n=1 Tax=Cladocopium goreaui TaxID=2562237 RepID=A0A9P1G0V8_9DINO|nr:unnamed protein product [Cladocopium goreaui]
MSVPDYYSVLGLERDARPTQIKKAYFQLAKKMHPDRHHGTDIEKGATHAFEHLQKAYNVLSNPEKRRQYDASLGTRPGEGSAAQALRGQRGSPGGPSWLHSQAETRPTTSLNLRTAGSLHKSSHKAKIFGPFRVCDGRFCHVSWHSHGDHVFVGG